MSKRMVKAVQLLKSAEEELIHIFSLLLSTFVLVACLTGGTSTIGYLDGAWTMDILSRRVQWTLCQLERKEKNFKSS